MAQPSNTFDSYDAVGIREDLSDIIYNISPEETIFLSKCGKTTARNTLTEWQTDSLRASAANAHIEGDATTAEALATLELDGFFPLKSFRFTPLGSLILPAHIFDA